MFVAAQGKPLYENQITSRPALSHQQGSHCQDKCKLTFPLKKWGYLAVVGAGALLGPYSIPVGKEKCTWHLGNGLWDLLAATARDKSNASSAVIGLFYLRLPLLARKVIQHLAIKSFCF